MTLLKVDFPTNTLQLISPHLLATLFPLKFSALQCNSTPSCPMPFPGYFSIFFLSLLFPDPLGPLWRKALPAQLSRIGWKRYPFLDVNKSVTSLTAQFISSRSNLPVHAEWFDEAARVCVCLGDVRKVCQLALWRLWLGEENAFKGQSSMFTEVNSD